MGRTYFEHLRQHPQAEVVALCDEDEARRRGEWRDAVGNLMVREAERAVSGSVAGYAKLADMLRDERVEAVAITLPTHLHAETTIAALRAGKHVLCEKPMALTLPACERMLRAAHRSGRTLMIAQCIRFWPQYERIKEMVDGGELGEIRFVTLRRLASPPVYSADNWLLDGARSGGALLDLHVHDVDFAHYLLGVPRSVQAWMTFDAVRDNDHVVAAYEYDDGSYALLEGGWAFQRPWPFEMAITVAGERGTLDWSLRRGPEVLHYAGDAEPRRIEVAGGTGWTRELDYFIRCVRAGVPVSLCTPESSRTSLALALLERSAAKAGRRQRVPATWRAGE